MRNSSGHRVAAAWRVTLKLPPPQNTPEPTQANLDRRNEELIISLREQFGLKLEYRKAPVEVFVVDHVEPSSEN